MGVEARGDRVCVRGAGERLSRQGWRRREADEGLDQSAERLQQYSGETMAKPRFSSINTTPMHCPLGSRFMLLHIVPCAVPTQGQVHAEAASDHQHHPC